MDTKAEINSSRLQHWVGSHSQL